MHPTPQRVSAAAAPCRASRTAPCSRAAAASPTTSPCPAQTVIAFLRSPYAHARIVGIDVDAAARRCRACSRVFTGAELAAAGVKPMPTTPGLQARRRHAARVSPLRRALAHEFARFVGEAVAAVVAETREARRATRVEAIVVDYEELPAVTDARAATAPGAPPSVAPTRPTTSPPRCATAMPAATAAAFARAAHRVALDLVNQRLAPAPMEPRCVVAAFDEASGRLDGAHQQPDAHRRARRARATRCPASRSRAGARARRRRRRRLRHEDRHLSGGHRRRLRGAGAEAPGAAGRPSAARSSCRRSTAATSRAMPSSRSTPTAGCWRCACARSPTSAPTRRRPASRSSC